MDKSLIMNKSKTSKKKVFRYQNKSTSLSQLLSLGAYKKRIKNLERNNRSLAKACATSRCELASQSKLIQEYHDEITHIMLARLKLKDIAKRITEIVTCMDDVNQYLNIKSATKFTQRNGSPYKFEIKVPTVDIIEEVSVISPDHEHEVAFEESAPLQITTNHENINFDGNEAGFSECGLDSNEIFMPSCLTPPILFAEESEDLEERGKGKKSSRTKRSRRQSSIEHRSLTPELNIDWKYKCTRSSSRRQSRNFSGSTGSNEVSKSPNAEIPPQIESCEKITSPPELAIDFKYYERSRSSNRRKSQISSASSGSNKVSRSPESEIPLQIENCKSIASLPELLPESLLYPIDDDGPTNFPRACTAPNIELLPKPDPSNHTLLLNEDMELTDVISNSQIVCKSNSCVVLESSSNPGIVSDVCEKSKINPKPKEKSNAEDECIKVNAGCRSPVESSNASPEHQMEDFSKSIVQEDKFMEQKEENKSFDNNSKTPECKVFFTSSDDSESGHTPPKTVRHKLSTSRGKRATVIFKPAFSPIISKAEDCSVFTRRSLGNKINARLRNSVFDFDSSLSDYASDNQELKTSKQAKSSRRKKSVQKKDVITKPLLQNCTVTKLKGFGYKFGKNKSNDIRHKHSIANKQNQSESVSDLNVCMPSDALLKEDKFILDNVDKNVSPPSKENCVSSILNTGECSLLNSEFSPNTSILKHVGPSLKRKRSENKKVSFAPSDLICNFKKMSLSRTIADNAKVRRTSKSAIELDILPGQENSEERTFQQINVIPYNDDDSSDETEFYTLTVPNSINIDCPMSSEINEQKNLSENCNKNQNSGEICLNTKSNINDNIFYSSGETEIYTFSVPSNVEYFTRENEQKSLSNISFTSEQKNFSNKSVGNGKLDKIDAMSKNRKIKVTEKRRSSLKKDPLLNNPNVKHISAEESTMSPTIKGKWQKKRLFNDNSKENLVQTPETFKTRSNILSSKNISDNKVNTNMSPSHKPKVSIVKVTPLKFKSSKSNPRKVKKSRTGGKSVESSPVFKDMMNLPSLCPSTSKRSTDLVINETGASEDLPRRRTKPISYKEPPLNKKMRRG